MIQGKKIPFNIEDVAEVLKWKLFFDKKTKKPIGSPISQTASGVYVCGPNEALPIIPNRPKHIEERMAVMIILKKGRT